MREFHSRISGSLALLVGVTGLLAVVSLGLFFVGLLRNIPSLSFMGAANDWLNALAVILSAALATVLYPALNRLLASRLSLVLLTGVWAGAIASTFGSWLIQTGRADVELSSYYYFFGNGLVGIWLWALNRAARQQAVLPGSLTGWGLTASLFMMVGLLGLYGILLGLDGDDYSPLIMVTGISFLGIGILYPIWCLRLGRWMLGRQEDGAEVGHS